MKKARNKNSPAPKSKTKKPKTKAKLAKMPAPKSPDVKQPYGLPAPEQIAQLAATLAKRSDDNPTLLAHAALHLWRAAEAVHFEWRDYYRNPSEIAAYSATLPQHFPMTRDDFLAGALPAIRRLDRLRAWKHYKLAQAGIDPEKATVDESEAASSEWKSPENAGEFLLYRIVFLKWWENYHAAEVSKSKSEARKKVIADKAAKK
jgi:hypothetical protein